MAGIVFDPITRDIVVDGSSVKTTEDPTTEILLAIGIELDTYHGDPEQGSRIPALVTGEPPADTQREVELAALDALERLASQGILRVTNVVFDGHTLTIDTDIHRTTMAIGQ